jgi:hypothetical protein
MRGQSETMNTDIIDHIYYTLLLEVCNIVAPFFHKATHPKVSNYAEPKPLS